MVLQNRYQSPSEILLVPTRCDIMTQASGVVASQQMATRLLRVDLKRYSVRDSGVALLVTLVCLTPLQWPLVYDLTANKRTVKIYAHKRDVNSCCWADPGSGNVLISASDDSFLKVWCVRSRHYAQYDPRPLLRQCNTVGTGGRLGRLTYHLVF